MGAGEKVNRRAAGGAFVADSEAALPVKGPARGSVVSLQRLVSAVTQSAGPSVQPNGTGKAQRSAIAQPILQRELAEGETPAPIGDEAEEPRTITREALRKRWTEIKPDCAEVVKKYPACHSPPQILETYETMDQALKKKQFGEADVALRALTSMVSLAKSFAERLSEIRAQTEMVDNDQRRENMEGWIKLHEAMDWATVVATKDNTHENGSLAALEYRLEGYAQRVELAAASASAQEKKKFDLAAAARAKAAARKQKIKDGLLTEDGRSIRHSSTSDLSGEELAAVNATIGVIDGGPAIILSHNSGAKFNHPFGNRDGDLPGGRRSGGYTEFYVEKDPNDATYHGSRRLVKHTASGRLYYTSTHYGDNGSPAFVRIR